MEVDVPFIVCHEDFIRWESGQEDETPCSTSYPYFPESYYAWSFFFQFQSSHFRAIIGLFAWAENKRLKVLLADLYERNTASWLKISG
jgi:hypothetical protein